MGDKISAFLPKDNRFYPGLVESDSDDSRKIILYEEGDKECLGMTKEIWNFIPSSGDITSSLKDHTMQKKVLRSVLEYFGNKNFHPKGARARFRTVPIG